MLIPERAAQPVGRYAAVRTVSQVMLRLERDSPDAFKVVRDEVLDWVRGKAGKPLPKQAWDGLTFELDDVGAQRVAAAHLEQPKYWAARVDDACKEVAQRTWITEIGLAAEPNGRLMFGCRLVVSARGENPRYQPSIPAFIGQVVGGGRAFLDERLISPTPWVVCSDDDVDHFHRLLSLKSRRADVCAISLGEDDADPASAIISVAAVHRRTLGAAHVAVLTGRAAYMLTDLVGKEFSVFNRAVRTYRPNFDTDADDPRRHPLALFGIALAINVGMWLERFVIISISLHRDYMPSTWEMYYPTVWDWSLYAGTFGIFVSLLFLFLRLLPAISMAEVRELVHQREEEQT